MWVDGSRPCSKALIFYGFTGFPRIPPQKPTLLNSNSIGNYLSLTTGLSVVRLLFAVTFVKQSPFVERLKTPLTLSRQEAQGVSKFGQWFV